jgi:hypothetical protein
MIAESPARFEPYRSNYQRHINGNSIYKLGDPCFNQFLDNVYSEYGYDANLEHAATLRLCGRSRLHRAWAFPLASSVGVPAYIERGRAIPLKESPTQKQALCHLPQPRTGLALSPTTAVRSR